MTYHTQLGISLALLRYTFTGTIQSTRSVLPLRSPSVTSGPPLAIDHRCVFSGAGHQYKSAGIYRLGLQPASTTRTPTTTRRETRNPLLSTESWNSRRCFPSPPVLVRNRNRVVLSPSVGVTTQSRDSSFAVVAPMTNHPAIICTNSTTPSIESGVQSASSFATNPPTARTPFAQKVAP
ncbi:hypothetical protein PM082_019471 [Marasmius tenuissimus]|nr:hypothetical protein PM082_019471 [Marasmius tenuissimus]